MNKYLLPLLGSLFIIETIYFNIFYDYTLLVFLLVISLAVGGMFSLKLRGIDLLLVKCTLGLGSISFFIWLTTLYDLHHKSLFCLIGFMIIVFRFKVLARDISLGFNYLKKIYSTHNILLALLLLGIMFYTIPASYPITQWDSLSKHIVIPYKIFSQGYYDYNVVESIIFGDYALLAHMLYLFLMVLGGTKALVLLNVMISVLTIISILRLTSIITRNSFLLIVITLIYFTTPLIYNYSTILNVDIYPIFFISIALIVIQYDKMPFLSQNLPSIALIFGFAFFSKQVAFYMIVPLCFYIIVLLIKRYKFAPPGFFLRVCLSFGLFFLPFAPAMFIIWYKTGNPLFPFLNTLFKSPYFSLINFQDPYVVWKRFLEFDLYSLWSIVFNTSRNIEYVNGGAGYHLLIIPLVVIIWPFMLQNRRFFIFILLTLGTYWVSITFFNPNIRYFLGAIVFAIPLTMIALYTLLSKINKIMLIVILPLITLVFVFFNLQVIKKPSNPNGYKSFMLEPDNRLTLLPTEEILNAINFKDIYLLSNNENLRGTYKGHFYTLTWYNTMFIQKLDDGMNVLEFLENFDYYLINKKLPFAGFDPSLYKNEGYHILHPQEPSVAVMLDVVKENETYILYKIKKQYKIMLEHSFDIPIIVDVEKPKIIQFSHKIATSYRISIDAMPIPNKPTIGRFQINWLDQKGNLLEASILPFELKDKRNIYESNTIVNIPTKAVTGELYLTSHSLEKIKIFGYKLEKQSKCYIDKELTEYGQKLMPTYK